MSKLSMKDDPRIDPRIRALMGAIELPEGADVSSREEMLQRAGGRTSPRGSLRVYLGMAPGVGKTYEMLQEAHRRLPPLFRSFGPCREEL